MKDNEIQVLNNIPSFLTETQIKKYQECDNAVVELMKSNLTGMSLMFAKITVVEKIESALDDEFMKKVMNLKGKEYGFKTDERAGESYPDTKVKAAIVQALMFGAELTGNEFNILGGNCYLTKVFCKNWLRKNKVWYKIPCSLSQKSENGTFFIKVFAEWIDFDKNLHKETLDIPVAKHSNTSEATMKGCAERDAMAFIIEELRKESLPMDKREEFDNYVDLTEKVKKPYTAEPIYNENVVPQTDPSLLKQSKGFPETTTEQQKVAEEPKQDVTTESVQNTQSSPIADKPKMVDEVTQKEFDAFISNKQKIKTIQELTVRAKNFCGTKGITSAQLNFDKYNEIKQAIDEGRWV
jgi:hypothetical protein